jgi:hypothetical protein
MPKALGELRLDRVLTKETEERDHYRRKPKITK